MLRAINGLSMRLSMGITGYLMTMPMATLRPNAWPRCGLASNIISACGFQSVVLVFASHQYTGVGFAEATARLLAKFPVQPVWPMQVLMVTRSREAAERARALAVVQGVVERVQENYLLLVPEMLPFLSELLEDPDIPIVAQTQQLLKHLEQLSGEDLGQYMKH